MNTHPQIHHHSSTKRESRAEDTSKPKQTDPAVLRALRRMALNPAKDPSIVARNEYRQSVMEAKRPAKHAWEPFDRPDVMDILHEVEVKGLRTKSIPK